MLLNICKAIKYEMDKVLDNKLIDKLSELEDNKVYLYQNMENNKNNSKDNWLVDNSKKEDS